VECAGGGKMNKNIAPTNPCHCGNCDDVKCYHNPHDIRGVWCNCDHEAAWKFTKEYGCLKHPVARKFLNESIIKKLEEMYDKQEDHGTYYEGLKDGYDHAITLCKGEKL